MKFEPCPVCGGKAVYSVGGVERVRVHGRFVDCKASGMTLEEAKAAAAPYVEE